MQQKAIVLYLNMTLYSKTYNVRDHFSTSQIIWPAIRRTVIVIVVDGWFPVYRKPYMEVWYDLFQQLGGGTVS